MSAILTEPLLDEQQAAKLLNVAVGTLRNGRARGRGPAFVKMGTSVRYRSSDIADYVEARVRRQTSGSRRREA